MRERQRKIAKLRQSCDSICVHNLHRQPLLALLQLITFVCTTVINNFYALRQLLTFVCTYDLQQKNLEEESFNEVVHITIAKEDEIILCNESITSL